MADLASTLIVVSRTLEPEHARAVRAGDEAAKRRCLQQAADLLDCKMPSDNDLVDLLGGLSWLLLVRERDATSEDAAHGYQIAAALVDEASGQVAAVAAERRMAAA